MRRSIAQRFVDAAQAARDTPGVGRALYAARAHADRALIALQRPPFSVSLARLEAGALAGYLRHRAFLDEVTHGSYESFSRELFLERIRPGVTVVDGGAHIGLFTILAAPRAAPTGKVYAFEADPYNFDALRINVSRNGLTNVRLANEALADVPGEVSFFVSSGTVASSLVSKSYVHDTHPVTVTATTIDAEVPRAREIVVKLDVEGAEERVLVGAAETLHACTRGRVIAEQNLTALRDAGSSGERVVALLRSFGFSAFHFVDEERQELVEILEAPPARKGNLLADKG
jgi:FkbM family methyltransferase